MLQQILKRLELIKSSISLEDEDIIELQVTKINSLDFDKNIADILDKLSVHDYAGAVRLIDFYIAKNSGLVIYEDVEVQGLKLELKSLENKFQELSSKKADYTNDIDDFNRDYSIKLGPIIREILSIKKEILFHQVREKKQYFDSRKNEYDAAKAEVENIKKQADELYAQLESSDEFSEEYEEIYEEYSKLKEYLSVKEEELTEKRQEAKKAKEALDTSSENDAYEEAKADSERFEEEYEVVTADDFYDLNDEQLNELKMAFKRAARLCHPDIVADELKEKAHEIMAELNVARQKKDLVRVKEILLMLQSGEGFIIASDKIYDKDLLISKIANIKKQISSLAIDINQLEASETYKIIQNIESKDMYFEQLKAQLFEESENLKISLHNIKNKTDSQREMEYCFESAMPWKGDEAYMNDYQYSANDMEDNTEDSVDNYWREDF